MSDPDFTCHKCGAECMVGSGPGHEPVCEACCEDHDYVYEHGIGHYCQHCGKEPPADWWDE